MKLDNMSTELSNFLSIDIVVLAVLVLGSFLYTFMLSRGKLLAILISTYMAFVLAHFAPFLNGPGGIFGLDFYILRIIVFVAVFLAVLFLLSNIIFQTPVGAETLGWFFVFWLSFLQVGFLLAVFFSFLPEEIIQTFSKFLQNIFASPNALFIWAFLPVVFLAYIGFRINKNMDELEDEDEEEEE